MDRQLKDKIIQHFLSSDGKVLSSKLRDKNLQSSPYKELWVEILEKTKFIRTSVPKSARIYAILKDIQSDSCHLQGCDKPCKYSYDAKEWHEFCCLEHSHKSTERSKAISSGLKKTFQDRKDEILEARRKTCIEKYGTDSYSKTKEFRELQKDNIIRRPEHEREAIIEKIKRNNPHLIKTEDGSYTMRESSRKHLSDKWSDDKKRKVSAKRSMTNMQKYGTPEYFQSNDFKEKIKDRINPARQHIPQKSLEILLSRERFVEFLESTPSLVEASDRLGVSLSCVCNYVEKYNLADRYSKQSSFELDVKRFLDEIGVTYIERDRKVVSPKELDFYLPDQKIAIECNGMFWHSEIRGGKNRNYHVSKTELCEKKGIQLFHIFEDSWNFKKEIWKSVLRAKIGIIQTRIAARNCKIMQIDNSVYKKFLEENHLQGYIPAQIRYALVYDDDIVMVMSFGKSRYNRSYDWELLRCCSKKNMIIIGGMGRLLNAFMKENRGSIISYANRCWSAGKSYEKIGFVLTGKSDPSYIYTRNFNEFFSRLRYQKHRLQNILEKYDPQLSEWENMQLNGFDRIWDCGQLIYVLTPSE